MLPIVWLLGTSGVGKSTVGYRLVSELATAGVTAAFVDADQLRLAGGVRATETELIAAALPTLIRNDGEHGARALIVAGVVDDAGHLARLLPEVPRDLVLTVHLHAVDGTIRERVHRRGWLTELADAAVDYAARIAQDVADLHLDTTNRSPAELARQVADTTLAHIAQVGPPPDDGPAPRAATSTPARMVAITGPGGVGVSTTAFQTFSLLKKAGEPAGYLDAHQLGLVGTRDRGDHLAPLRSANLRAVAGCLARAGAETVVVSGDPHTVRLLVDSPAPICFWLHASAAALAERITGRARGDGPALQGDHRIGLAGPALTEAISAAVRESADDLLRPPGARTVDTSDLGPREVAEAVMALSLRGPARSPGRAW